MMDSTTITLFDNMFKGVGRHTKSGKKKGGMKVQFIRGELTHEARRVEIFHENKKPVVLLTNNFDFTVEDVSEIYRLRWTIESLYKQLKQHFPLHFFYGDSVNAIQIQTWVVLIANLFITVLSRSIKRKYAFSQIVTMACLTLGK